MGELVFRVNGVDFIPFIAQEGLSITSNDIDSDDAGMLLNGVMRRDRVAVRYNISVTPGSPFTLEEVTTIMQALYPEWVTVEFNDPVTGQPVSKQCYNSKKSAKIFKQHKGKTLWVIDTFSLIDEGTSFIG